ncbi:hypothetical protein M992_1675 [Moellerella wisconsensis ATCC 35017]|uniref:Uncharacterized protein n=1 Tax=Moellerella wisconsensis ATCC 35017 TaxID=1354267 RepID=A0A0N0I9W0_9GAMM|nr:hypothetical protein M992_1675 [Moellerella wisconsensis ATCC 35017]
MFLILASTFATADAKPVSQWTSEDPLTIDDAFYPTAIGVAEIITQKDKI